MMDATWCAPKMSKEISGFAALKRTIRQVETNDGDGHQASRSLERVHSKKKDVMVSPLKPPNSWHALLKDNLKENVANKSSGRNERVTFLKSI